MFNHILFMLKSLSADEEGAELAEYGLVLALVAIVTIGILTALGGGITNTLQTVVDALP